MPLFKVEIERHVSRVVELRQTASLYVESPDLMAATAAVSDMAWDEEALCDHRTDWEDDNDSRQASNDEEVRRPTVQRGYPAARAPKFVAVLNAMPKPMPKETEE